MQGSPSRRAVLSQQAQDVLHRPVAQDGNAFAHPCYSMAGFHCQDPCCFLAENGDNGRTMPPFIGLAIKWMAFFYKATCLVTTNNGQAMI
jgi:hypothetical protein